MKKIPKIGFIGTGLMGTPMSRRLHDAGYPTTVWNRSREKCTPLAEHGLKVAKSLGDLVRGNDIIMTCVTDTSAVEAIVFCSEFLDHASADKMLVDFSSIDPEHTREFAQRLQRQTGMIWIDCPVSGGVAGAESGNLVMMAGGDVKTIDQIRPVLSHLFQRLTHMGDVGSGQATKVCNQMIVSCNVLVMAEVLALAKRAGVDASKIPAALAGGFADSIPLQLTGQRMVDGEFDELKWHVKTLAKDLAMAAGVADSHSGHTPMAKLAHKLMREYCNAGYADLDPANLIKAYLET